MKTVVTGGNGFIGSHLVKMLLGDGRDVVIASSFLPREDHLMEMGVKAERRNVDLRDYRDAQAAIEGADSVFHLAARIGNLMYLHGTQTAELTSLQTNLSIDTNVFRACFDAGVKKIVYASSCAVYPMDRQVTTGAVFKESDLPLSPSFDPTVLKPGVINPDGGYGWAKLMGEIQLWWARRTDIGIARIFSAYGENEPLGERAHAMGDLIQRAILNQGGDFVVYGDGKQTRDFLYVTDCARALIKLEEKAGNPPVTANIGSGQAVSIGSLARRIVGLSGKKFHVVFDRTKPVGPVSRSADMSKAKVLLGWEPQISLDEGLRRTYDWVEGRLRSER
jgi:nucleoside-diphosphate-sugar epimerase